MDGLNNIKIQLTNKSEFNRRQLSIIMQNTVRLTLRKYDRYKYYCECKIWILLYNL